MTILLTIVSLFYCNLETESVSNVKLNGKHLFILSGQSNMAGLNPKLSFIPTVEEKFGKENVIVVKDAQSGQPIRRWYKNWKSDGSDQQKQIGDLFDRMMKNVKPAIDGSEIQTITFLWMQGERDAREKLGEQYAESFSGLIDQIKKSLGRDDVNFVIGRLSDFDMQNKRYPHWTMVREAQMKLADDYEFGAWVDTDDLNDGKNGRGKEIKDDLHYSVDGYKTFGKRLADEAIKLVEKRMK